MRGIVVITILTDTENRITPAHAGNSDFYRYWHV